MDQRKSKKIPKTSTICFINYAKAFDCVDHSKLQKFLKEMGISYHLTCLLRNLFSGQETTEADMKKKKKNWFQIKKGVCQGCLLSPCLFNLYVQCIMQTGRVNEAQVGIKSAIKTSITSDMQITPPLWQKVKRS